MGVLEGHRLAVAVAVAVDMIAQEVEEVAGAVETHNFRDQEGRRDSAELAPQARQARQAKPLAAQQTSPRTQAGRCPS
jgi:hypothetical protein